MRLTDKRAEARKHSPCFIGRVQSRSAGAIRLVESGAIVHVNECPTDDGKLVLLERHGDEYQPEAWET